MKVYLARGIILFLALSVHAQVSVLTSRNDNSRDGLNPNETTLTTSNVNVTQFGKLFSQKVNGYVYAQPLYVPNVTIAGTIHNVVYVATEHDSVYAFDADSNTGTNASPLWHRSFIFPKKGITTVSDQEQGCDDIYPEIGITSTPVIDSTSGTLYLAAKTDDNGTFTWRLHALDITTGKERPNSPRIIKAKVKGTGAGAVNGVIAFDPLQEGQRPGLLLQNGTVFIGFASYCDHNPYHGWLLGYDASTMKQTAVWNSTRDGKRGGIWQSGTGLAGDGTSIFLATGNGTFDANIAGKHDYGDSVTRLVTQQTKAVKVADYFTPYNQGELSSDDRDVGSGGVLLLPDQGQQAPHEFLAIAVGKEGSIYLIDRDKMGHFHAKNNNQIVQDMENAIGSMFATAGWWNNNVYFGGSSDYLRQYTFDPTTGLLSTSAVSESPGVFGYPGPTPSISANGTSDAIVWAVQRDGHSNDVPETLHAYDATNLATELYNTDQNNTRDNPGDAVKYATPTVVNGKVYVGAIGQLSVYGLLNDRQRK